MSSDDKSRHLENNWPVDSLGFAPVGKLLASGIALWEVASGKQIRRFDKYFGVVAFALGGHIVAAPTIAATCH